MSARNSSAGSRRVANVRFFGRRVSLPPRSAGFWFRRAAGRLQQLLILEIMSGLRAIISSTAVWPVGRVGTASSRAGF
eukprot:9963793-Alexandrium_andersonii.AAC.1